MSTPAASSAPSPAQRYAKFRERQADPEFTAFRQQYDFAFDDFQVAACGALSSGDGVLVAAPTGSGKTVIGEYAVHLALAQGRKCFYTTPIKALSNQKYGDLARRYGSDNVGLLTGDNSVNGEAPVVVMTTEVLRNMLYAGSATLRDLAYVVLDEVHYLADRARGAVWEEVIIHLPESVRVVALSATVSNAEEFGDWLAQVRGGTQVVVDEHRPVPLWQHMLAGRRLYDLFTDDDQHKLNPELVRLAQRDVAQGFAAGRSGSRSRHAGQKGGRPRRFAPPYRPEVIDRLDGAGLLPAITFIFSRAGCDAAVQQCLSAGLRLTTADEADAIQAIAERRVADIPEEDLTVLGYHDWLLGRRRGIAAHHAGLLPVFKEVVEELFAAGLVRAVFATETLALGVNMPARTVVIERLDKWNGETHAPLTAGEYTQLTGRAGRRGIDVEGHAVVLWQPGLDPGLVAGLAGTRTYPLNSSFRPSYNMAVNLTGRSGRQRAAALLESSFAQFQADRGVVGITRRLRKVTQQAEELKSAMACDRGDFSEYVGLRRQLTDLERDAARNRASSRRAEALRSLGLLRRGDIIRVPGGRRAGMAVVLAPPPASAGEPGAGSFRQGRADGPLVLTSAGQVRQLWAADFPAPAEPVERLRIPGSFSERSPRHRRDLVSSMRAALAGREAGDLRPAGRLERDATAVGDVAEIRRKLRRHPCHDCPEREQHARYGERYVRLQRDIEDLQRQISGRSHVIARTFQRVCTVLEELGYLDGDTVTPDGRRLGGIYSELDLLAAECLRRGFWTGLNPAELAACVSVLTFESRQQTDDAGPARLPKGPVRDVLSDMTRTWAELDQMERRNSLSFLREPDLGFVWAAYRWVRGAKLEDVLESVPGLTPGDFVRAIKQLMDLLDQIAGAAGSQDAAAARPSRGGTAPDDLLSGEDAPGPAPAGAAPVPLPLTAVPTDAGPAQADPQEAEPADPALRRGRGVAATARAAIEAMRRGVVAYTALAE
jgi:ATP-dependent RNA helicase HelY